MATRTASTYCEPEDINLGDIQLPRGAAAVDEWIKDTADEIDATLGQIYRLPFSFDVAKPADRADALLLKKINKFLAMGRMLCTAYGAHEGSELHSYGRSMIGDAKAELGRIVSGQTRLESLTVIGDLNAQYDGPIIVNKEEQSPVDVFYRSRGTTFGIEV